MISAEQLRALIDYDPATGTLIWKYRATSLFTDDGRGAEASAKAWNNKWAGKPALHSLRRDGYREGRVFRELVLAHRAAWAIQYGEWPEHQIDHINHIRDDNRFVNLRHVTNAENAKNMSPRSTNTSGVQGVWWHSQISKWAAGITLDGRHKSLGCYETLAQAAAARKTAEALYGFHENHGASAC